MAQLTLTKSRTPAQLVIRVMQDPYDESDPIHVSVQSLAMGGNQLGAGSIDLHGVEADMLDSIITATVEVWRWGAGQGQILSTMRFWQRKAREHARAHGAV